jgi:acyl-CoA synthetase (AMP-forming)/AMP-acid ligase II
VIGPGDALPDGPPLVRDCVPDALGALFYTSGTTGRPKGAMLTHRALELSALPESEIRNLVPAPLFHVMGSLVQWLPTCLAAGTTVLMSAFDAGEWLRAIEAERISVLTAVPAMYWLAIRKPEFAVTDLSSVRRVGYGAAPTPPAQVSWLMKAFPLAKLCPGYGLTETCGIVSGLPHDYALDHADAVGFAMPATDIALSAAGSDGAGELLVRGPQLMSGAGGKVIKPALRDETPWGPALWLPWLACPVQPAEFLPRTPRQQVDCAIHHALAWSTAQSTRLAYCSWRRSSCLRILPIALRGSASRICSCSGIL